MLISYKYNNFLSFRQEAEFTMLAPSSKVKSRFPNNYVELENGYQVLKDAVIVGENAGGKSNFVRRYICLFFCNNLCFSMTNRLNFDIYNITGVYSDRRIIFL